MKRKIIAAFSGLVVLVMMVMGCSQPSATPAAAPIPSPSTTPAPSSSIPASAKTYALPGDKVFPEGIAYDPKSNSFFTGSTTDGSIFRGSLDNGQVSVFSAGGSDGRTSATGMKVDSQKRRLWIDGAATGLLFAYNVDTGALIRKYTTPQAAQTFLNDVALAPNGDAYFTDSYRPVLFKISSGGEQPGELESWLDFTGTPVQFTAGSLALNGIAVSQDGAYILVVHTSAQKLYRITVSGKTVSEVNVGSTPLGGDGMLLDGQTLYVLVRTQTSNMIVRIKMAADFSSGTVIDNFRDDSFAFPTTIARVNNRMLVVNAQFDKRGEGQTPILPFTVSDIPIPPEK